VCITTTIKKIHHVEMWSSKYKIDEVAEKSPQQQLKVT
jgi:hypothetical protein